MRYEIQYQPSYVLAIIQTRGPGGFVDWLIPRLPAQRSELRTLRCAR